MGDPVAPAYPPPSRLERALDLVFPPVCAGCRSVGRWICPRCWPGVSWDGRWLCPRCGRTAQPSGCTACPAGGSLIAIGAVARFEGTAREAVHALKYSERHAIAPLMSRLMAPLCAEVEVDVVAHVPLHRARRRERGYDQAQMLAKHLAREIDVSWENLLVRTRRTAQQALIGEPEARQRNVEGAFRAKHTLVGQRVLLVDDVTTTGATLVAAAEALREAGAGEIRGVVFGHGLS